MDNLLHPTGILFDPIFLRHLTGGFHPERPSRLDAILASLKQNRLLDQHNQLHPRKASLEELSLAHHPDYISLVERECERCRMHGWDDGSYTLSTGDVQISPASFEVASHAAGGALSGIDALFNGKFHSVFCALRPPGHHACYQVGMGFCLFNNAVIAARYAQKKYGLGTILIVDWDVHHGNGTQELVYNDPTLLYFSTHQWPLYPGTGNSVETGCGNIKNCPIAAGAGSKDEVLRAFREDLPKLISGRMPELVVISAGFDAHRLDPLGGFELEGKDFGELTRLVRLATRDVPILSVLEGGYNLSALAESVPEHVYFLGCSKL